ncbi:MAG TPA: very short patch repair endonuclease [Dehalococcoidia bacterium]|nr:very short patch repair endonuclease [Dehalococcoidia bacterium]
MDRLSREKRSLLMSRIRSKDTQPEILVRRALWRLGVRYRLHVRSLPGRPDVVIRRAGTVIQVKGCYWHAHRCQEGRVPPGPYWREKLTRNKARDRRTERALRRLGWRVLVVWECQVGRLDLGARLRAFLDLRQTGSMDRRRVARRALARNP